MRWITLLFLLLIGTEICAAPFTLKLLSTTEGKEDGSPLKTLEYEVEGTPFRMVHRILNEGAAAEVHLVDVYRGNQAAPAASSTCFLIREPGKPVLVSVWRYQKFDGAIDAKGIGELILQPMLQNPEVKQVNAQLAHENQTKMNEAILAKGKEPSVQTYNEVVMDHSHFGKVLGSYGFKLQPDTTSWDGYRGVMVAFTQGEVEAQNRLMQCVYGLSRFGGRILRSIIDSL